MRAANQPQRRRPHPLASLHSACQTGHSTFELIPPAAAPLGLCLASTRVQANKYPAAASDHRSLDSIIDTSLSGQLIHHIHFATHTTPARRNAAFCTSHLDRKKSTAFVPHQYHSLSRTVQLALLIQTPPLRIRYISSHLSAGRKVEN